LCDSWTKRAGIAQALDPAGDAVGHDRIAAAVVQHDDLGLGHRIVERLEQGRRIVAIARDQHRQARLGDGPGGIVDQGFDGGGGHAGRAFRRASVESLPRRPSTLSPRTTPP
jgi:hypothetical protein